MSRKYARLATAESEGLVTGNDGAVLGPHAEDDGVFAVDGADLGDAAGFCSRSDRGIAETDDAEDRGCTRSTRFRTDVVGGHGRCTLGGCVRKTGDGRVGRHRCTAGEGHGNE